MEKKNWEENEFQKQIRITEEDLNYIKRIRGKTSTARKLQEIIKSYHVAEKSEGIHTVSHPTKPSPSEPKDHRIPEVIKLFEEVNPSYEKLFCNKTQRSACERLLKKWSIEQIKAVVGILPELNANQYAKGKSITPLQLEENLGYIKAFIDQKKNNSHKIVSI